MRKTRAAKRLTHCTKCQQPFPVGSMTYASIRKGRAVGFRCEACHALTVKDST